MHERLEQLMQLHKMCQQELDKLQTNVGNYVDTSSNMVQMIEKHWPEIQKGNRDSLAVYDNFLTSISHIMTLSRKFNIQLQLYHSQTQDKDKMFDLFVQEFEEEEEEQQSQDAGGGTLNKTKTGALLNDSQCLYPAEEIASNDDEEEYQYTKQNLNDLYKVGHIINAHVTYLQDVNSLKFFIMDIRSEFVQIIKEIGISIDLHQYQMLPDAQEIFGMVLEQNIFRAVHSDKVLYDEELNQESWPCYLLDYGETVQLKMGDITYKLKDEHKSVPSLAILCELNLDKSSNTEKKKLEEKLYDNCDFKVIAIKNDRLIVQYVDNESKCEDITKLQTLPQYKETNPFRCASDSKEIDNTYQQNPFVQSFYTSINSKTLNNNHIVKSPTDYTQKHLKKKPNESKPNQLTAADMELLYDEPFCTSNAMKAVLGYDPQDDKRICRFYDPETGACFKGAHCKQEHVAPHPEGYTKDVIPTFSFADNRCPQIVYPIGAKLTVTPTFIGSLCSFYAQINDSHHNNTPLIWNDEDIPAWKRLERPPHMHELVLSRYEDDLWYRAKILSHDDDYRMFNVFYVDYGNTQTVHLRELAKCDYSMAHLPFQATLIRLSDVKEANISSGQRKKGIQMLCETLLNLSVDVKVESHHEDLMVTFLGDKQLQLQSILIDAGFIK